MRFGASKFLIRKFDLVDYEVQRNLPNVGLLLVTNATQGAIARRRKRLNGNALGFWIRVNCMG